MSYDWREARLDRLTERVDLIEQERREERQRAFERNARILLTLVWMMNAVIVTLAIASAGLS
jgi:hypothetical protein